MARLSRKPDTPLPYDATDDDAYAEGDVPIEEWDAETLGELAQRMYHIDGLPKDERPMANLALLHEMYGDDLEIL